MAIRFWKRTLQLLPSAGKGDARYSAVGSPHSSEDPAQDRWLHADSPAVPESRRRLSPLGSRRAVPDRLVERHRLRDPLELERPHFAQLKAVRLHEADEVLAGEDAVLRCL